MHGMCNSGKGLLYVLAYLESIVGYQHRKQLEVDIKKWRRTLTSLQITE